ncbi:MAG: hypothetical protein HQK84_06445 [Nitrospinae bacterium]|nr:hypothetical protein [Nitrospinota bacterium]
MKIKYNLFLFFLFIYLLSFSPLYADNLGNKSATVSVISEISLRGNKEDLSRLEERAVSLALKNSLIEAASKRANDRLNTEIVVYYKSLKNSELMSYIHGYNIVSLNYDDSFESLNLVLKIFIYAQPIINDFNKFNITNSTKEGVNAFIIDTNFINFTDQPFDVTNVILEEFNIKGINTVYFIDASDETERTSKINNIRQTARLIVDSKLIFTQLPSGGIKAIISFKTINSRNETIKAMSFSLVPQKSKAMNDSIIELIERMVEMLLNNYTNT